MPLKKVTSSENTKTALAVTLAEAQERVGKQLAEGESLASKEVRNEQELTDVNADYNSWRDFTAELLKQIFNTGELSEEFSRITVVAVHFFKTAPLQQRVDEARKDIRRDLERLSSIQRRLELFPVMSTERGREDPKPIGHVELLARRFHYVVRQLRQRHANRPTLDVTDEYDVQYLLHALLKIFFNDIRPEEWTPSYAGGSSRMDFLLKAEKIVVEVKKTRSTLKAKEVGDELLIDIARYQTHPDCRTLVCLIYDPDGYLANPDGLESDLSRPVNQMAVTVIVTPKG